MFPMFKVLLGMRWRQELYHPEWGFGHVWGLRFAMIGKMVVDSLDQWWKCPNPISLVSTPIVHLMAAPFFRKTQLRFPCFVGSIRWWFFGWQNSFHHRLENKPQHQKMVWPVRISPNVNRPVFMREILFPGHSGWSFHRSLHWLQGKT